MANEKLLAVENLAIELMDDYELIEAGWTFGFDNAKARFGLCDPRKKRISVSSHWAELLPLEDTRGTMLHEIAHALVGTQHRHNMVWAAKCREIGGDGERCGTSGGIELEKLWTATCPQGHTVGQHRAPLRVKSCGHCSPIFSLDHVYTWSKGGVEKAHDEISGRYTAEYLKLSVKRSLTAAV